MNLLAPSSHPTPCLLALSRAAGTTALGLLLMGLAAGSLRAQEPDAAAQTNAAMQVEDLVSALRSLQPEDSAPGDDAGGTNDMAGATNEVNSGSGQSYRRPSGRESRSRWSSRQRTNRFGSDLTSGPVPAAAANATPASLDYANFRLVVDRNIFDPNRRPHTKYAPQRQSPDPVYFAFVGTMSYEEGTFAFFSGSSVEYQKALKCADTIAGYKVTAIDSESVKLTRATNQVELHVGMQMNQGDDGAWTASSAPTTYTVNDFQPASSSSAPGAAASSGGTESEILKRLMEKREKE